MFNTLVNYIKNDVPEKVQDMFIFVSYNLIYLYSKLQIIYNKKTKPLRLALLKNEKYNYWMNKFTNIRDTIYYKIYKKQDDDDIMSEYNDDIKHDIICDTKDEKINECCNELLNENEKKTI